MKKRHLKTTDINLELQSAVHHLARRPAVKKRLMISKLMDMVHLMKRMREKRMTSRLTRSKENQEWRKKRNAEERSPQLSSQVDTQAQESLL